MKKLALGVLLFLIGTTLLLPIPAAFAGYVNGYYRSNGTYVKGYYRTEADGNPYNNYSYPGNYNPNKGTVTGGNADTYLRNYYKDSGSGSGSGYSGGSVYGATTYSATPSCPLNSYYDGISSCKCSFGYVVSGSSCVYGATVCHSKLGIWSNYDSLSNSCKCDAGYSISSYGTCTKDNAKTYTSPLYTSTCPKNSHVSTVDSSNCVCDTGYKLNSKETGCSKKTKNDYIKACREEFGSRSTWNNEIDTDGSGFCICAKNYQWNEGQTKCVKAVN